MTKLGGYMAFIFFVHAAIHDADKEQRMRLHKEVRPLLDAMRDKETEIGMREVMDHVLEIMGPNWTMNEESRKWIDTMLEEK
jgi:hypothetical protein